MSITKNTIHVCTQNPSFKEKNPSMKLIITCILLITVLALNNLSEWAKPEIPEVPMINKMDTCFTISEPLGVALIIGAWNYPVQLSIMPLTGAISAGKHSYCFCLFVCFVLFFFSLHVHVLLYLSE